MYQNKKEIDKAIAEHCFCMDLLPEDQKLKYEIAKELGLYDKILECGWKGLTSKESGRIGGILNHLNREHNGG